MNSLCHRSGLCVIECYMLYLCSIAFEQLGTDVYASSSRCVLV